MKFTTLITSFLLSLFLLSQPAKADISKEKAQNVLKALKKLMKTEGVEKTFEIINTHSASNSVSPGSRDQAPGVIGGITQALGDSDAQVFCVRNSRLVASNRYPTLANGRINVVAITDVNGNQPFAQMIGKLKELKLKTAQLHTSGLDTEINTVAMQVINVFPHILDAENRQMLKTPYWVLLVSRHELLGHEVDATLDQEDKFFCGVDSIRF